jgi:hypothetical protein
MHGSFSSRAARHSPRRMASNRMTSSWVSLEISYPFRIRRQKKKEIVNCNDLISDLLFFSCKKTSDPIPAHR